MPVPPPAPAVGDAPSLPAASFEVIFDVPETDYRTAIAIRHDTRMKQVAVQFALQGRNGNVAVYRAICPRCHSGEIEVAVKLDGDGSFAEAPACPALCIACEDKLDSLLEPEPAINSRNEPGDRATLNKHIKAMTTRSWD